MLRRALTLLAASAACVSADPTLGVTDGLVLRLESGGLTPTSSLFTWSDASSSGNDLTCIDCPAVVDAVTPTGRPAVVFDGVNDVMTRGTFSGLPTGGDARTMVTLTRYRSVGYGGTMYGATVSNMAYGNCVTNTGFLMTQLWAGTHDVWTDVVGTGAGWFIQTSTVDDAGDGDHWANSVKLVEELRADQPGDIAAFRPNTGTVNGIVVGAELDGTPFLDMDLAAALIYDRYLNASERAEVEQYLTSAYLDTVPPTVDAGPSLVSTSSTGATVSVTASEDGTLTCAAFPEGTDAGTLTAADVEGHATASSVPAAAGQAADVTVTVPDVPGAYVVVCSAEDRAGLDSAASAGVAATVEVSCADGPAEPVQPVLTTTEAISGSAFELQWLASDRYLQDVAFSFSSAGATSCDSAVARTEDTVSLCVDSYSLSVPLTQALSECGFSDVLDGGDSWFYSATVEATAVENATSAVFGDVQTLTTLTSFELQVVYPKNVSVNGTAGVFGAVIDQSALTEQTFDSLTQEFGWNLATSVQYPYYLEAVEVEVSGGHTFDTVPVVASGGDCSGEGTDAAPAACRQDFALSANETDDCLVPAGTTVTVTFQILCRPQYAGSCDLPEGNTTTASFSVATDNFCPQVVEVASITPALTTYAGSAGGTVSTNYILETTLFARVTADVEAGLRAQRTTLTGLDIVSSCSTCTPLVQPFPDTSAAAAAYGFAYVAGGTDNSATGEVETDFSFTLNTNSLSFDNDASTGEAQITLTAYVTVEYDTPSAQGLARSYRVQAVSGPGSIGSSATAQAGVSSSTSSSTTAGSTVLGVSTGTAALAAVGLAAVAAVAFGAAVAAKRRRTPLQPLKQTSSSVELNDTAAIQA